MRLTDFEKKLIKAEILEGTSMHKIAKKYGVSVTTIVRVRDADTDWSRKIMKKEAENTRRVFDYMDSKKDEICGTIDLILSAMKDPEKLKSASINQLAISMGILIDKYTMTEKLTAGEPDKENNLFAAIDSISKELDLSDIREIQPKTEADDAVVGDS